jgi:hypothetical protein
MRVREVTSRSRKCDCDDSDNIIRLRKAQDCSKSSPDPDEKRMCEERCAECGDSGAGGGGRELMRSGGGLKADDGALLSLRMRK